MSASSKSKAIVEQPLAHNLQPSSPVQGQDILTSRTIIDHSSVSNTSSANSEEWDMELISGEDWSWEIMNNIRNRTRPEYKLTDQVSPSIIGAKMDVVFQESADISSPLPSLVCHSFARECDLSNDLVSAGDIDPIMFSFFALRKFADVDCSCKVVLGESSSEESMGKVETAEIDDLPN